MYFCKIIILCIFVKLLLNYQKENEKLKMMIFSREKNTRNISSKIKWNFYNSFKAGYFFLYYFFKIKHA